MLDYKLGVVFIFLTLYLAHTQIIVEGNVSDNQGPLAGVNVLVEGTSTGVISDFDGNFQINVSALNQILIFSYVGYQPLRLEVTSNEFLQVSMQAETGYLDEVVVVGYGTQTKSNLVGSVVSVDVEEANQVPTTNISELLRGRAAGVQVNLGDPRPGGFSNIVIRGNVSVAGGNNPLIIVDGLPYDNLNDIPADDIASIEILKDASSTAIYGARASNGVVLVTTKTAGETAKPRFSYSNYLTTQRLTRNFNLYSGEQFADLRRQANRNRRTGNYLSDGIIFSPFEREAIENNLYVDWEDLVLDDAQLTNHTFSVTTGGPRTKWYSSINYFNQSGIIPNSKYNRLSLKLNLNQKLTEKINVDVIVNYQDAIQEKETGGLNFTTITPLAKPFDDEGKLLKYYLGPTDVSFVNPLWDQRESVDEAEIDLIDVSLKFNFQLLPNLYYALKTFQRNRILDQGVYRSSLHSAGDQGTGGIGVLINGKYNQILIENILNYTPDLGENHNFDFTAVQAFDQQLNEYSQLDKSGFLNDGLLYDGLATELLNSNRNVSRRRILSFMGRTRYSFKNKYLFEATIRADASSVFAEDNKWGYFPAVSGAWKLHQDFFENSENIDELKLRVSYGATGNQGINPLESLGVADFTPYVFGSEVIGGAVASSRLPNPKLKWETTLTANMGIDFAFFNRALSGTLEVYQANTIDLLLDRSIASSTGFSVTRFNVGELQNTGAELTLNARLIDHSDIYVDVGTVLSTNKNKVMALTGETDSEGHFIDISSTAGRLSIGESINSIWLPQYAGIFQEGDDVVAAGIPTAQPGDVWVVDKNQDGQIDDRDNVFVATDPDWYGSFTGTIRYQGFDLFADFYTVQGATRINSVLANGELWKGAINGIVTSYYTPEFPSTEYPRPKQITHAHLFSFAVRDASYFRLRTLTVGYTLPEKWRSSIGLDHLRVYFTGTNLFTYTDFPSYSPEQDLFNGVFPETLNISVGLHIEF